MRFGFDIFGPTFYLESCPLDTCAALNTVHRGPAWEKKKKKKADMKDDPADTMRGPKKTTACPEDTLTDGLALFCPLFHVLSTPL